MPPHEMEIEAIADAGSTIYGESVPLFGSAEHLRRYDVDFIKPALLLADHVTLRSGNEFVRAQFEHLRTEMRMPLRAFHQFLLASATPDRSHLHPADITELDLADRSAATAALQDWHAKTGSEALEWLSGAGAEVWTRWGAETASYRSKMHRALAQEVERFEPQELRPAIDQGVLEIKPHVELATEPFGLDNIYLAERPSAYQLRAAEAVLQRLRAADSPVMLDPWAEAWRNEGQGTRSALSAGATLGLDVVAALPGVLNASIDEILDIREELRDPLRRFRGAMVSAGREWLEEGTDRNDFLRTFRVETVGPAIAEIDERVKTDAYLRQLIRSVKDPAAVATQAGLPALAFAVTQRAAAPLVAAALGLGHAAIRALVETTLAEKGRTNPFYILHRLGNENIR